MGTTVQITEEGAEHVQRRDGKAAWHGSVIVRRRDLLTGTGAFLYSSGLSTWKWVLLLQCLGLPKRPRGALLYLC